MKYIFIGELVVSHTCKLQTQLTNTLGQRFFTVFEEQTFKFTHQTLAAQYNSITYYLP